MSVALLWPVVTTGTRTQSFVQIKMQHRQYLRHLRKLRTVNMAQFKAKTTLSSPNQITNYNKQNYIGSEYNKNF